MSILTRHLDKRSVAWDKIISVPFAHTTSITKRNFAVVHPGESFKVQRLDISARTVTGSVVVDAIIAGADDNAIITAGAIAINATPEKYQLALSRYIVGGVYVEKAAELAVALSAAHAVAASKFGIILIQISNAGVLSTKVPAATPTTAMTYATAPLALAALPEADAGKLAIGYIAIAADSGGWLGITDDMTNASDLTTATFTTLTADAISPLASALTVSAAGLNTKAAHATKANYRGTADQKVYLFYTTDGTGALTDANVQLVVRPYPIRGDGSF